MTKIKTYELEYDGRNTFINKVEDTYINKNYIVAIKPMDTEVVDQKRLANVGDLYQIFLTNCVLTIDEKTVNNLIGEGD